MADLQITTEKPREDMAVINPKGRLDVTTYFKLEKVMSGFLDDKVYKIIIDLSELEYIGSVGAGVFIGAASVVQEHNGTIVLVNPQPEVKTVLRFLRPSKVLRFVNNMEDAFKGLGNK